MSARTARGSPPRPAPCTIDHAALDAFDGGAAGDARPRAATTRGGARGRRPPPPDARRDQLRLGLVPDAAQAARALRLRDDRPALDRARPRRRALDNAQLRALDAATVADVLGQARRPRADVPLRAGAARARRLARRARRARRRRAAGGSAEAFAAALADAWRCSATAASTSAPRSRPRPRPRRRRRFHDLDRLTIFADNLVPHVLRCDGVLVYDARLAAHIDAGRELRPGPQEREIRACAVHACELLARACACRRACSTTGCGTAARAPPTRRVRGTAAAASTTDRRSATGG